MKMLDATMAQRVAEAIRVFQEQRTGHSPKAVTVVLSDDTLVVTLHEALSPAEKAPASTPEGAARVQEFHRQLFDSSVGSLREEIRRITGVAVGEAAAEVETMTGAVTCVHKRHDGTGFPARRQHLRGRLGTGTVPKAKHETGTVCHASPVKETSGIGGRRQGRWFRSPA